MSYLKKGEENIWLPYTQMKNHLPQLEVERVEGCKIFLKDGRVLLDGISSWWSVAHGYSHPKIVKAVQDQAQNLSHVMLAGLSNEQTYKLANRLCEFAGFDKVFFSDSGSTAIEVAMKISWQYFINKGEKERKKFVSFKNSYHGDTTGAMSLADLDSSMHKKFKPLLLENFCLDLPKNEEDLIQLEGFLEKNQSEIAAIFVEPLVQCAGGMKFFEAEILQKIFKIAKKFNILFVADECAVGFYRLGKKFACEFAQIEPDILVLGKALTGGMLTMAATLVRQEIFDAFLSDFLDSALMHGPTFMGNPLAAAAANASLDLFEEDDYAKKVSEIEAVLRDGLEKFRDFDGVKDVRVFGALGVIETDFEFDKMLELRQKFVENGVFLRPFAGVIYLMPPLVIEKGELRKIFKVIEKVLA